MLIDIHRVMLIDIPLVMLNDIPIVMLIDTMNSIYRRSVEGIRKSAEKRSAYSSPDKVYKSSSVIATIILVLLLLLVVIDRFIIYENI